MRLLLSRLEKLYKILPPILLRDLKERYAGSVLGIFWAFLQPLLLVLLFWLVFSQILKVRIPSDTGDVPFIAFLLSGLLPWFAFQDGVMRGTTSILDKRHIIKKVIFPSNVFPLSAVLSSFIHHGIGILLFLVVFFIWKGELSHSQLIFIPLLFCLQILLASGLALFFSSIAVYVRDITQVLGFVFQLIFYTSTILYPLTAVPESLKKIILLNPVTSLAEAYHSLILYDRYPDIYGIGYLVVITILAVLLGIYTFRRLKRGFSDVL